MFPYRTDSLFAWSSHWEVHRHRRVDITVTISGEYKKAKAILDENTEVLYKSGRKEWGKVYQDFEEDVRRRMELLMFFSQTRRREESPITIANIIMISLDSDSHFKRGPQVDLQRAEDLGTSSTETTNTSKRSLTGKSTIPPIIQRGGGTLTSAEEKLNSFSLKEFKIQK